MSSASLRESRHFTLEPLTNGVYACIHRPGGAAYSNAGIVDLGDRTLLVDAFDTLLAGRDLRQIAEALFERPVETIVLTHAHIPHADRYVQVLVEPSERILEIGRPPECRCQILELLRTDLFIGTYLAEQSQGSPLTMRYMLKRTEYM